MGCDAPAEGVQFLNFRLRKAWQMWKWARVVWSMAIDDAWNAVSATGTVDTDDDDNSANYQRLQWRNVLTAPVTITLGKTPKITLAFDADGTIGFAGNIATASHCTAAANATTGLFVMNPKVTITIAN